MRDVGAGLRLARYGGTQAVGGVGRWRGVAAAAAVATLLACATPPPGPRNAALERSLSAGLGLYDAGEYAVAARRFYEAAGEARALGDRDVERRAVTAECVAWLRARALGEFARCTDELSALSERAHRAEPGLGTLLAFGAIAGERRLPPFRIPPDVTPVIRLAVKAGEDDQ